jgi:hypothetical protein
MRPARVGSGMRPIFEYAARLARAAYSGQSSWPHTTILLALLAGRIQNPDFAAAAEVRPQLKLREFTVFASTKVQILTREAAAAAAAAARAPHACTSAPAASVCVINFVLVKQVN